MDLRILKMLIELTGILDIKAPECVYDERRREDEPLCELMLSGYQLVFRTDEPKKLLVYQMAYSLRRLYQYLHDPAILRGYRYKGEIASEDFINQPAEIDAHAFACCFCYSRFDTYISDESFSSETLWNLKWRCRMLWRKYRTFSSTHRRLYVEEHIKAKYIIESRKEYMKTHRKRWRRLEFDPRYEQFWYFPESHKEIMENARKKTGEEAQSSSNDSKSLREHLEETAELFDEINSIYGKFYLPDHDITDPEYEYLLCFDNIRRYRKKDDDYDDYYDYDDDF